MKNIRMIIEYDGSGFFGSQKQKSPRLRTVQGILERRLTELCGEEISLDFAGRTDKGVHAKGMHVNFHTKSPIPVEKYTYILNRKLPGDIRVLCSSEAESRFSSRFSAKYREYEYIVTSDVSVFTTKYKFLYRRKIDLDIIRQAFPILLGEHNFGGFCKKMENEKHHLVNMMAINAYKDGTDHIFTFRANRFLHNMIRILMGTFLKLSEKGISLDDIREILDNQNIELRGDTIRPGGLYLLQVGYE